MFCLSFVIVTVRARLAGLSDTLEQAAADLYATPQQTFWKVTFPLVFPGILGAALLAFSLSFDDFIITNLNAGTTTTFPMYVWGVSRRTHPDADQRRRHRDAHHLGADRGRRRATQPGPDAGAGSSRSARAVACGHGRCRGGRPLALPDTSTPSEHPPGTRDGARPRSSGETVRSCPRTTPARRRLSGGLARLTGGLPRSSWSRRARRGRCPGTSRVARLAPLRRLSGGLARPDRAGAPVGRLVETRARRGRCPSTVTGSDTP